MSRLTSLIRKRQEYLDIQARRAEMDKCFDGSRKMYTYSYIVARLAEEFYKSEASIEKILQRDVNEWFIERGGCPTAIPKTLFK